MVRLVRCAACPTEFYVFDGEVDTDKCQRCQNAELDRQEATERAKAILCSTSDLRWSDLSEDEQRQLIRQELEFMDMEGA